MMQDFVQRYEKEEEKQNLLLAVDVPRNILRTPGRKSNKLSKSELTKSLKRLSKQERNEQGLIGS